MDKKLIVIGAGAIGLGVAAAIALAKKNGGNGGNGNGNGNGGAVTGSWEFSYSVPRDGKAYACVANLYANPNGEARTLYLNLAWNGSGWDIDPAVQPGPVAPSPGVIPIPGHSEWHGTFSGSFKAAPFSRYDAANQFYWPYVADTEASPVTLFEISDNGSAITARISASGDFSPFPGGWIPR